MNRTELARFLRARRARLEPADVALPAGLGRRTPGLRREEVADLAGISTDYYVRLEQARGPRPSSQVLRSLARALRLSAVESDHLHDLAGHARPPGEVADEAAPQVRQFIEELGSTPAQVINSRFDVLASNRLATAIGYGYGPPGKPHPNLVWTHFKGIERGGAAIGVKELLGAWQWEMVGRHHVARLRAAAVRYPGDRALVSLVQRLRSVSAEFAALWDDYEVDVAPITKRIWHPVVGRLELDCSPLQTSHQDQLIVTFTAPAGSPTVASLRRLAALTRVPEKPVAREVARQAG